METSAMWAAAGVVKPDAMITSHEVLAPSVAVAIVKVSVPEFQAAVKVDEPHVPLVFVAVMAPLVPVNPGSVTTTVSPTAACVASVKRYFTCVDADVGLTTHTAVVNVSLFSDVLPVFARRAPIGVDTAIGASAKSAKAAAAATSTFRVDKLASWAAVGVVRPEATIASQEVLAPSGAVATVRVNFLVVVFQAPVKVAEPHVPPVFVTVMAPVEPVNAGRVSTMVSPTAMSAVDVNKYFTWEVAPMVAVVTVKVLCVRLAVIAVDVATALVGTSPAAALVLISTVLVAKLAACVPVGVVSPEATVTVHAVVAAKVAVAAVKVRVF